MTLQSALHGEAELAVPFQGQLSGLITATPTAVVNLLVTATATGTASLVDHFTLLACETVNPLTGETAGGTLTITAANGDQLIANYSGFLTLNASDTISWQLDAVINSQESTGRFAGAVGGFTMIGQMALPEGGGLVGPYTEIWQGSIVLQPHAAASPAARSRATGAG
jgi:hypothetical protein